MNNTYKLVLFYDHFKLQNKNIICLPRNEYNLIQILNKAELFITFENVDYTYFNIITAIKNNCLCIIPKYYKNLKNKCISFNKLDNTLIKNVVDVVSNKNKLDIFQKINKTIIQNHLINNKWINL